MSTNEEMRAIRAAWSAQGVQTTLPLLSAGYVEASPLSASYPFKPVPTASPQQATTLDEAYRLADATGKPVSVPGVPYLVQPDYRPGFTTAR